MKEIVGELWDYFDKPNTIICITTNGAVRTDGKAVMGRGCAFEAAQHFKGLPKNLGTHIREHGNIFWVTSMHCDETGGLAFFPVKHKWWEQADIELIKKSALGLAVCAIAAPDWTFILPRPGCGNGRLTWAEVKPVLEFLPDNVLVISKG